MIKQFFLWFFLSYSLICYATDDCITKEADEHHVFYQNNQRYDFSSYSCGYNSEKFINPAVLEIKGDNLNIVLKDVIGHKGMIDIGIVDWNDRPSLSFDSASSSRTEAYMTLTIKNESIFVDCIYVSNRLKNLINAQYSFCDLNQLVVDGANVEDLIPDFYLDSLFELTDYSEVEDSLSNQSFDIFIGKIGNLSIYRRYLSQNDYLTEKYNIIISSKDKQYQFKQTTVYQRINSNRSFLGLDVTVENNIVFYDEASLLNLLKLSEEKRNIHSYIQRDRVKIYHDHNNQSLTNMYLVKGDTVIILDEYTDQSNMLWFKISYKSNKLGRIIGWIQGNAFNNF